MNNEGQHIECKGQWEREAVERNLKKPRKIQSLLLWVDRIELKLQRPSFMGRVKGPLISPCCSALLVLWTQKVYAKAGCLEILLSMCRPSLFIKNLGLYHFLLLRNITVTRHSYYSNVMRRTTIIKANFNFYETYSFRMFASIY